MGATELRISCESGKIDVPRLVELPLVLHRFQRHNQNYLALNDLYICCKHNTDKLWE